MSEGLIINLVVIGGIVLAIIGFMIMYKFYKKI